MNYTLANSNLGNALKFSTAFGLSTTNPYILVPDSAFTFIDGAANNFSYSCWFTPTILPTGANYAHLICLPQRFEVLVATGQILVRAFDGVSTSIWTSPFFVFSNFYNLNQLNHIVVTFDRSNLTSGGKIYLNGNLAFTFAGSASFANPPSVINQSVIGSRIVNPGPNNFCGYQSNVSLYNKILTQDEVTHLYQLEGDIPFTAKTNLKFSLNFDEKSGTNVPDSSTGGNNGTCTNYGTSTNLGQGAWVDSCTLQTITI